MSYQGTGNLRFDLLGVLRVSRGGVAVDLGPPQQRVVLGVLLMHAGRPFGREQLIEAVWDSAAPSYAVNLVQKYVSRIRRSLEPRRPRRARPSLLTWTDGGYLLSTRTASLDLTEFDQEIERAAAARTAGELRTAANAVHNALSLWRGPFCDGLDNPFLAMHRDLLAERRINLLEERIEIDLALGAGSELVAELRVLVAEHPLRERLRRSLMIALYRSERQADALATFHEARRHLRDELGIEPGAKLHHLYQRILRSDSDLLVAAPADGGRAGGSGC
jgi:DNA-binding SARP family transcriptional activator